VNIIRGVVRSKRWWSPAGAGISITLKWETVAAHRGEHGYGFKSCWFSRVHGFGFNKFCLPAVTGWLDQLLDSSPDFWWLDSSHVFYRMSRLESWTLAGGKRAFAPTWKLGLRSKNF